MKILKKGRVGISRSWRLKAKCRCTGIPREQASCGTTVEITEKDLRLVHWVADCGYKGMRYYYAVFTCPCCGKKNPVPESKLSMSILKKLEKKSGFSGYALPDKHSRIARES